MVKVMALFQLHFLQNACVWVRMAPGQGHLYRHILSLFFSFVTIVENALENLFLSRQKKKKKKILHK